MSIIKMVLDKDWANLREHCDKLVAKKIADRIAVKKVEVLAKLNKKSVEEMTALVAESLVMKESDDSPKAKVIKLLNQGKSRSEIADMLDLEASEVDAIAKELDD
jgi:hypothetical protein